MIRRIRSLIAIALLALNALQGIVATPVRDLLPQSASSAHSTSAYSYQFNGAIEASGAVKAGLGYATVRNGAPLSLPASQLFRTPATPGVGYLVETDPAFTDYRRFLSSDYFLAQ
uniref:hypothetical protein n=1 Tax=uncultured Xylophilus sp. TaxID=296832 RepID=UPI0025FDCDDF